MSVVLQFEIDLKRWGETEGTTFNPDKYSSESPSGRLYGIIKTAACDTLHNGGTLVLVVTPEKVTIVQRSEVDEI